MNKAKADDVKKLIELIEKEHNNFYGIGSASKEAIFALGQIHEIPQNSLGSLNKED